MSLARLFSKLPNDSDHHVLPLWLKADILWRFPCLILDSAVQVSYVVHYMPELDQDQIKVSQISFAYGLLQEWDREAIEVAPYPSTNLFKIGCNLFFCELFRTSV